MLVNSYPDYESWGKFAAQNYKKAFFGLARVKIEEPLFYNKRKFAYMISATNRLMEAKKIVEKWKS